MRTTLFCFAADIEDAGPAQVLADACERAGVDGLSVATAYHAARDLLPHALTRRVPHLPPGLWIRPERLLWQGCPITPLIAGDQPTFTALDDLIALAERNGRAIDGWTVFLHADRDGADAAVGAEHNIFGDPYPEQLCPANPATRAYAVTLARAVVRAGMPTVVAESLHYHGLEHGVHHERLLFEPGAVVRLILGLCMCSHCFAAAKAEGVDTERVQRELLSVVQATLDSGRPAPGSVGTLAEAGALCGGELAGWIQARQRTVTTLVEEVAQACRVEGGSLVALDLSGAAKGYADGLPTGDPASVFGWRFGIDSAAISRHCTIEAIAYAQAPERVDLDLATYRALIGRQRPLGAILRPFGVDCEDAENLAAKLRVIQNHGAERVDFYHYGMMPLPTLDRIREALSLA